MKKRRKEVWQLRQKVKKKRRKSGGRATDAVYIYAVHYCDGNAADPGPKHRRSNQGIDDTAIAFMSWGLIATMHGDNTHHHARARKGLEVKQRTRSSGMVTHP